MEALAAIREAALIRFRPIIMTTLAALLGALPIALAPAPARSCASRSRRDRRRPVRLATVTLYITPVVYYYLDKIDSALAGRRQTVRKPARRHPRSWLRRPSEAARQRCGRIAKAPPS